MTSKICCTIICAFILVVPTYGGNSKLTRNRLVNSIQMNQQAFDRHRAGAPVCDKTANDARFDCFPGQLVDQQSCEARGCCWKPALRRRTHLERAANVKRPINVPYCFFPQNYEGYTLDSLEDTPFGQSGILTRTTKSGWPKDIMQLKIDVYFDTETRLRFKVYDPNNKRYEVPIATPKPGLKAATTDYDVKLTKNPFGITVTRKSTGAVLFDTAISGAPLVFADQFIQISTHTGTGLVYGLGEHKAPFLKKPTWDQYTFWARDHGPDFETNLYGDHLFYVNMEKDGQTHGVFLLNSNAMDVDIQPLPALTYRTIGGILDFFIFTGPSPDSVVEQYTDVILKPFMPPFWAFGFHLCRYDYPDSVVMKKVIQRNRAIGIPYDVQWNDIDYMERYLDWTYDKKAYGDLPEIVKDLHDHDQKYVIIVDPGISNSQPAGSYPPYDEGIKDGIFMVNASGQVLIGSVWPGSTAYPDFTHPKANDWWYRQANRFHNQIPFDGLWTDMNEPSNFVYGSTVGCPTTEFDNPPYVPGVSGGQLPTLTTCPSAKQYIGRHYDIHSMYGLSEVISTNIALKKIRPGQRPFIITRSSYPSEGHFGGHWSGDIHSTWEDLHYSIPSILNFQLFGIPFVGADICGFTGDTTEELCTRWMQLGAFYPFMRNHNDRGYKEQDPAAFSSTAQKSMRKALEMRYTMLPYMYSRMHISHVRGTPVVRPLVFQYPQDANTYDLDQQFLWGSEILVTPVLQQGATSVKGYLPKDRWYEGIGLSPVDSSGQWMTLDAPLDTINYHIRGGSILPLQKANITTVQSRKSPFDLLVALNTSGSASGFLYWDDGDTLETYEKGSYTAISFKAEKKSIISSVDKSGYKPEGGMLLDSVTVLGVTASPNDLTINGKAAKFKYNAQSQYFQTSTGFLSLLQTITIQWK